MYTGIMLFDPDLGGRGNQYAGKQVIRGMSEHRARGVFITLPESCMYVYVHIYTYIAIVIAVEYAAVLVVAAHSHPPHTTPTPPAQPTTAINIISVCRYTHIYVRTQGPRRELATVHIASSLPVCLWLCLLSVSIFTAAHTYI